MARRKNTCGDLAGLQAAVASLPAGHRDTAETLLCEITYMHNVLMLLKEFINNGGPVITTPHTVKENPALKAYNTSIMRYSQLLKQLTDILPAISKAAPHATDGKLYEFLKQGQP